MRTPLPTFESKDDHNMLEKFLKTTLTDERKGYYWIFTNSTLKNGVLSGNINDEGGHGGYSKSEIEDSLKEDKKIVEKKLGLLKQALDEFNKENNTKFSYKYTLNDPRIETSKWQGSTVYDSPNLVAHVTIQG